MNNLFILLCLAAVSTQDKVIGSSLATNGNSLNGTVTPLPVPFDGSLLPVPFEDKTSPNVTVERASGRGSRRKQTSQSRTKDSKRGRRSVNTIGIHCEEKNGWDADQYCVCPKGHRISQFNSVHNNGKEDRQWDLKCTKIPNFIETSYSYPSSSTTNIWDGVFWWKGGSDAFLVGMKSYHSNSKEDRRYTMFYTRSDKWKLERCSGWKLANTWDGPMKVFLDDYEVIVQVFSRHNNRKEDRLFYIKTCFLVHLCSEIVDIAYDVRNKKVLQTGEVTAGSNGIDNTQNTLFTEYTVEISKVSQEKLGNSYSFESSTSNTQSTEVSWKYSAGIEFKIFKATQEFGITLKTSTTKTNTLRRSETSEYTEAVSQKLTYKATCPPYAKCSATILVKQEKVSIPYTITRKAPGSTTKCVERGNLVASLSFDAEFIPIVEKST